MVDKDLFMSQITEETCAEPGENSSSGKCTDFQQYFEKRLNQVEFNSLSDYLIQQSLNHHLLVFQAETGCYRLSIEDTILDFPSNWSIFEGIKAKEIIQVDYSMDNDFFMDIFSELFGGIQSIVLLKESQKVVMVFLENENFQDHLKWMLGYFEKRNDRNREKDYAA
jgi:hypothetical protein